MTHLLFASLLLTLAGCTPASEPPALFEDRVQRAMGRENVPGVTIASLKSCRPDRTWAFGTARQGTDEVITGNTLFEAASLTKPVFAYLYLQALQSGTVSLDEPLSQSFAYPLSLIHI